jgi:hypothetical protein
MNALKAKDFATRHDDGSTTVERMAIVDSAGREVCHDVVDEKWRADIIRAVNNRAALVAALEAVLAWAEPIAGDNRDEVAGIKEVESVQIARAALSRAKSE